MPYCFKCSKDTGLIKLSQNALDAKFICPECVPVCIEALSNKFTESVKALARVKTKQECVADVFTAIEDLRYNLKEFKEWVNERDTV